MTTQDMEQASGRPQKPSLEIPPSVADKFDRRPYRNIILTVVFILMVSFLTIMVNQIAQLVNLASTMHPTFGRVVLGFFILLAVGTVVWTLVLLAKLEKPLAIPDESDTEAYGRFMTDLKARLMHNRYLKQQGFVWDPSKTDLAVVSEAIARLDDEARLIIRRQAATVFITTAVSQNGSLDSLFVFITVMKLVWRISMHYHQRPALRDLVKLYTNIFGTVLLARQIDDLDLIAEQLEPVLTTLFGGTLGAAVPGISYVVSFVADSVFEGSLNTLLTLRVGLIAQAYARSLVRLEPRKISKTATYQACQILGAIVGENARFISGAIFKAVKNTASHSFEQGKGRINDLVHRFRRRDGRSRTVSDTPDFIADPMLDPEIDPEYGSGELPREL